MDQSITLQIAGESFPLTAHGPEHERIMRLAAERINALLTEYDKKFPDRKIQQKMVFVALNECMGRLQTMSELAALKKDIGQISQEAESYLSGLEK